MCAYKLWKSSKQQWRQSNVSNFENNNNNLVSNFLPVDRVWCRRRNRNMSWTKVARILIQKHSQPKPRPKSSSKSSGNDSILISSIEIDEQFSTVLGFKLETKRNILTGSDRFSSFASLPLCPAICLANHREKREKYNWSNSMVPPPWWPISLDIYRPFEKTNVFFFALKSQRKYWRFARFCFSQFHVKFML